LVSVCDTFVDVIDSGLLTETGVVESKDEVFPSDDDDGWEDAELEMLISELTEEEGALVVVAPSALESEGTVVVLPFPASAKEELITVKLPPDIAGDDETPASVVKGVNGVEELSGAAAELGDDESFPVPAGEDVVNV
jgi:hypothetical protein